MREVGGSLGWKQKGNQPMGGVNGQDGWAQALGGANRRGTPPMGGANGQYGRAQAMGGASRQTPPMGGASGESGRGLGMGGANGKSPFMGGANGSSPWGLIPSPGGTVALRLSLRCPIDVPLSPQVLQCPLPVPDVVPQLAVLLGRGHQMGSDGHQRPQSLPQSLQLRLGAAESRLKV